MAPGRRVRRPNQRLGINTLQTRSPSRLSAVSGIRRHQLAPRARRSTRPAPTTVSETILLGCTSTASQADRTAPGVMTLRQDSATTRRNGRAASWSPNLNRASIADSGTTHFADACFTARGPDCAPRSNTAIAILHKPSSRFKPIARRVHPK